LAQTASRTNRARECEVRCTKERVALAQDPLYDEARDLAGGPSSAVTPQVDRPTGTAPRGGRPSRSGEQEVIALARRLIAQMLGNVGS